MFRLLAGLSKRDYFYVVLAIALIVAQVGLELKIPDYMSQITRLVQSEQSQVAGILENGGYMLLCAFGSLATAAIVGYFVANVAASFSMRTRKKLFDTVGSLGIDEIRRFSTSSLITRTTNDITQIQMFLSMGAQMLVRAPMTAVWAVMKILNKSWQWSTVTGVAVVILMGMVAVLMSIVIPRFKLVQRLTDRVNALTRENLNGIRVVRAFNAERYQEKKFEKTNKELTDTQIFTQRALSVLSPFIYLIMQGVTLAIYFVGAYLISEAEAGERIGLFSDMVIFSSYAMQVIISFLMLALVFMMLPRAQVSAERVNEVLATPVSIVDGTLNDEALGEKGTVEFRKVSFKYPDAEEYLLKDISFKAKQGETVAFIGSTGSGKSTLINLVPRFYDATDGEVLVDGVDVKAYRQEVLRNKIGYVPQRATIFSGTVTSNVAYGDNGKPKATEKKIKEAVRVAQARDFVEKMEKKYRATLAQGGTNISGGQKQRLSIARAIARDPEIYIFDDSFSALDYKTDASLRKDLRAYTKDATVLIVAQRIGTIMNADRIVVLDKGVCAGMGTHKELLKNCAVYKQIALSQLAKEELDV